MAQRPTISTGRGTSRAAAAGVTAALLLVLLGGSAPAARGAEEAAAGGSTPEVEVRAALDRFVAAINATDWQAAAGLYADDPGFRWFEDGELRYASRDAVATAYKGLADLFQEVQLSLEDVRVEPLAEDAASVSTLFRQSMTTASGMSVELEGAILAVMVRREGGWRFLAGHTSTRSPESPARPPGGRD